MKQRFRVDQRFPAVLVQHGLSLTAVARQAQLPDQVFDQEKIWLDTDEFFALWRGIGSVSNDPAIGLTLGSEQRVTPLSTAMLYARSFAAALDTATRYKRLTCPEEIEVVTRRGESSIRFRWLLAEKPTVPPTLIDSCFAWLVSVGRAGTGTRLSPQRVELRRAAARARMYERYFGCPVVFGAKRDVLVFRSSDVERAFLTHNPDMLEILGPHLEAQLVRQRADLDMLETVKTTVQHLLAGGRPELDDVAREVRIAPRTLQRRLAARGRTYQQLLDEARRELSHRYLLDTTLELNETAFLLGYSDANSFFRAFRQWEGTSPSEWRSRQIDASLRESMSVPPRRR
ncbi:MAG TPA: AraC family transcriptional regulator ligand-binding domain-containing protein [Kofleriaceae bacterium]|jgi:AraC-like DNA-binding protein